MDTWFADNHVTAFTVSLFFKLANDDDVTSALVTNGDSKQYSGFSLGIFDDYAGASLRTDVGDGIILKGPGVSAQTSEQERLDT